MLSRCRRTKPDVRMAEPPPRRRNFRLGRNLGRGAPRKYVGSGVRPRLGRNLRNLAANALRPPRYPHRHRRRRDRRHRVRDHHARAAAAHHQPRPCRSRGCHADRGLAARDFCAGAVLRRAGDGQSRRPVRPATGVAAVDARLCGRLWAAGGGADARLAVRRAGGGGDHRRDLRPCRRGHRRRVAAGDARGELQPARRRVRDRLRRRAGAGRAVRHVRPARAVRGRRRAGAGQCRRHVFPAARDAWPGEPSPVPLARGQCGRRIPAAVRRGQPRPAAGRLVHVAAGQPRLPGDVELLGGDPLRLGPARDRLVARLGRALDGDRAGRLHRPRGGAAGRVSRGGDRPRLRRVVYDRLCVHDTGVGGLCLLPGRGASARSPGRR